MCVGWAGLVRTAPRMATGFLLLAMAAVGSPGTLGFVSEDLIVQGLLDHHSIAAVTVLVTTALNGIVLFLAFQRVFLGDGGTLGLGPLVSSPQFPDLLPRERWVAVALFGLLLAGGLLPAPLLAVRTSVVDALHGIEMPGLAIRSDERPRRRARPRTVATLCAGCDGRPRPAPGPVP
jgi:NADH:ubiquinone oxidoreductase subunit 4 (subunit M)